MTDGPTSAVFWYVIGYHSLSQFIFEHLPQSFGRERFNRVFSYLHEHGAVSRPRVGHLVLPLQSPRFPGDR